MSDSTESNDSNLMHSGQASGTPGNAAAAGVAGAQATAAIAADPYAFIKYLRQFVPALLDANSAGGADFEKCLSEKNNVECIKKFLGESQVRTLIIHKFLSKGKMTLSSSLLQKRCPVFRRF